MFLASRYYRRQARKRAISFIAYLDNADRVMADCFRAIGFSYTLTMRDYTCVPHSTYFRYIYFFMRHARNKS